MKKTLQIILLVAMVINLSSCKKDLKKTYWDVDILAPLLKSSLNLKNISNDTIIKTNSDSSISLIYESELYKLTLDTLINIPDTTVEYSANLNSLNVSDISISEKISLGEIAEEDKEQNGEFGGFYEAIMTSHNTGQPTTLDAIDEQHYSDMEVDAGEYFETLSLESGYIDVIIDNKLPIDLTNIIFELINVDDLTIILQDTFDIVAVNDSIIHTHSLAGMTISSNMLGSITISSPGSTTPVVIDTSASVTMSIIVRDIKISSATAIFPSQNIVEQNDVISIESEDFQLTTVIMKEGSIDVEVFNTLEQPMSFIFKMPEAKLNGIPLEISGNIPAAVGGVSSHIVIEKNITSYNFDFKGIGPVEQSLNEDLNGNGFIDNDTVNSIYYTLSGRIDSTGNFVTISTNDSIFIKCSFQGITPNYAQGFFGHNVISEVSEEEAEILTELADANIKFDQTNVSLVIKNQIGIESNILINEFTAINSYKNISVSLNIPNDLNPFEIHKPVNPFSLDFDVIPTLNTLNISSNNSNINNLIEIIPNKFIFDIDFITNPNNTSGIGEDNDFLYYADQVSVDLNIEVPLSLIASNLVLIDTTEINLDSSDVDRIVGGEIILYTSNWFPIEADVQLYLLDANMQIFDSLLTTNNKILAGNINPTTGIVENETKSRIPIPVYNQKLYNLVNSSKIKIVANFKTQPNDTHVQIFSFYKMKFSLIGDFQYRTK